MKYDPGTIVVYQDKYGPKYLRGVTLRIMPHLKEMQLNVAEITCEILEGPRAGETRKLLENQLGPADPMVAAIFRALKEEKLIVDFGTMQVKPDQQVKFQLTEFEGKRYLHIRQWYKSTRKLPDDEIEYLPTRSGVSFSEAQMDQAKAIMQKIIDYKGETK